MMVDYWDYGWVIMGWCITGAIGMVDGLLGLWVGDHGVVGVSPGLRGSGCITGAMGWVDYGMVGVLFGPWGG